MRIFFNVLKFFIENNENFNENVVTFNPKTKKNDPGTNGRGDELRGFYRPTVSRMTFFCHPGGAEAPIGSIIFP